MKFFLTAFLSGALAWGLVGARRQQSAAVVSDHAPNTAAAATQAAITVAEILALPAEKQLRGILRFDHISSVAGIMAALGQLTDLPEREAGLASQVLYHRWAELAPEQAMRYVLGKQSGDSSILFEEMKQILTVLRTKDPAHALDLLAKCDPHYYNNGWTHGVEEAALRSVMVRFPGTELSSCIAEKIPGQALSKDFPTAVNFISEMPLAQQAAQRRIIAIQWGEKDPAAALAWISSLPPQHQSECLTLVLKAGLPRNHDPAALDALLAHTDRPHIIKQVLAELTNRDPELALTWFIAHPQDPATQALQSRALSDVTAKNPEVGLAWLAANPSAPEAWRDATLAAVVSAISPQDPTRALALVEGLPDHLQPSAYRQIASALAKQDLTAAITLALDKGEHWDLYSVVEAWATTAECKTQGLQPLIDKLTVMAPERIATVIKRSLFQSTAAYHEFLMRLSPTQRDLAFAARGSEIVRDDLTTAANFLTNQAPGPGRSEALAEAAERFAQTDITSGVAWLAGLPDLPQDFGKSQAIDRFAGSYFASRPTEANAWVASLPPAQADTARSAYVSLLLNRENPSTAWTEALKISAMEKRATQLEVVTSRWSDSAAAQAAISASDLDPKLKQSLSQKIEPAQ